MQTQFSNPQKNLIVEHCLALLGTVSLHEKLEFIIKLSQTIQEEEIVSNKKTKNLFGAFVSDRSAEQQIEELRETYTLSPKIEEF